MPPIGKRALRQAQAQRSKREAVARTQALKRSKPIPIVDMTLEPRQERFCHEWLKDHNGTRAYLAAYPDSSPKSAEADASRLLRHAKVALRLANLMHDQLLALDFDAAEVLRYIRDGCRFDIRRLFDPVTGRPKQFNELTYEEASQIEGYEIILKNAEAGDGVIDRVLKVKLTPRKQFIEMAAIHFQLLVEQINVSGGLTIVDEHASDEELLAKLDTVLETARRRALGLPQPTTQPMLTGETVPQL